jgi:hypothetical protein
MRTARSRTSGENLFDLFMAPSSQRLEPPQNPGRFTRPATANMRSLDKLFRGRHGERARITALVRRGVAAQATLDVTRRRHLRFGRRPYKTLPKVDKAFGVAPQTHRRDSYP